MESPSRTDKLTITAQYNYGRGQGVGTGEVAHFGQRGGKLYTASPLAGVTCLPLWGARGPLDTGTPIVDSCFWGSKQ